MRLFPKTVLTKLLFLSLTVTSCNKGNQQIEPPSFDSFVFSEAELYWSSSIRFTQSDTIFFRRHHPASKQLFYSIIHKETLAELNTLIKNSNLQNCDTSYIERGVQDGGSFKFYLIKGADTSSVYIYGQKGPKNLLHLAAWLQKLEKKQTFYPLSRAISFGNLSHIIVTPPPLPKKHIK